MNENNFAYFELCPRHQHMPRSQRHERQSCSLLPTETFRFGNNIHGRNSNQLGIASVTTISNYVVVRTKVILPSQTSFTMPTGNPRVQHHLLADAYPIDQFPYLHNNARNVVTENVWKWNLDVR